MTQSSLVSDALPDFFQNIEIVGSAVNEITKYKALHAKTLTSFFKTSSNNDVDVKANSSPVLLASKEVKEIYQST